MKIHNVEVQKFKAASNTPHGQVMLKMDALIAPKAVVEGIEPSSMLIMDEANARVLMMLLKKQLAEFDSKKPASRHGRHG